MKNLKREIEQRLENGIYEGTKELIDEYSKNAPKDMDIYTYKVNYYIYINKLDEAEKIARKGAKEYPYNGDMQYNLAYVYELEKNYEEAWKYYIITKYIYTCEDSHKEDIENLEVSIESMIDKFGDYVQQITDEKEIEHLSEKNKAYMSRVETIFGYKETRFRDYCNIIGDYFYESDTDKKYVGVYRNMFSRYTNEYDVLHMMAEFIKVREGHSYEVNGEGEYFLPIACENAMTELKFNDKYTVAHTLEKKFNWYRVMGGTKIETSQKSYFGEPVKISMDDKKKKLILNIFVDGLAHEIISDSRFEKNMPNTKKFFENGTICKNAFTASDWTFPSIATISSGVDTVGHKLFHNVFDGKMSYDYRTLPEYFQKEKYFTSMLNGNWRIIPTYGHARGYDDFVFQHQLYGLRAENIVGNVIERLEAFKELNQFMWISIGDLHDIADGFDMPPIVQNTLSVEDRIVNEIGSTSVHQAYDKNKINMYEKMAKRIDLYLQYIYEYIEKNYSEDEVIVSLFADHGQGFLIPDDDDFLAKGRSNVAFMFKGGKAKKSVSDEIISTCDYLPIMCELAGITMDEYKIDGRLPKTFGGTEEREYAYTETIHPNEQYMAALQAKNYQFFLYSEFPAQNDGRFVLGNYTTRLLDKDGKKLDNDEVMTKCTDIVLNHIAPFIIYE